MVTYALGMAWVEAAVVYYLRTMVDRIEPHQANPLPMIGGLGPAELMREAATLVMLLMVGILAGRKWRSRLGYTAIAPCSARMAACREYGSIVNCQVIPAFGVWKQHWPIF